MKFELNFKTKEKGDLMNKFLDNYFKLKENDTNVKTRIYSRNYNIYDNGIYTCS